MIEELKKRINKQIAGLDESLGEFTTGLLQLEDMRDIAREQLAEKDTLEEVLKTIAEIEEEFEE